jgi:RNA polymerase sigma-70 factor (ECF subfamily)
VTSVADAGTLFALYQDRLHRYLNRATGQTELARDLTQEVFLRVSRNAIPSAPEPQLAGWLFQIARNVALDHHRQRQRRPEEGLAGVERAEGASQEKTTALNQALAALADLDRDVFLLREMSGLSYDEIATACELTPAAVRNRIHRARLELRELLAPTLQPLRAKPIAPKWSPGPSGPGPTRVKP